MTSIALVHNSADIYGASRSLVRLATGLDPQRYKPFVLLPETGPLQEMLEKAGVEVAVEDSLRVITRRVLRSLQIVPFLLTLLPAAYRTAGWIRRHNISLVHTNTGVIVTAALSAKLAGVKHIWHLRDWFQEFGPLWKPYSRYILGFSDKILCVSAAVARQFPSSPKVEILHNGFDLAKYPSLSPSERKQARRFFSLREEDFVLGTVGRIKFQRKGQEHLLKAAAILRDQRIPAKVILAGGPAPGSEDHLPKMKSLAEQLGLANEVIFAGEMADPRPAYAALDVFVLPSAQPEPFAGVVIEAMMLELPVLGTSIGGTVEQVAEGETGFLVPPANPEALAHAARRLWQEPNLRRSMGRAGRIRVAEKFALTSHLQRVERIYEELLSHDGNDLSSHL